MTSYRDPNLQRTYDVYLNAASYVEHFEASDRDMLKYIIGAIAKIDAPMTPSMEGNYSFLCYMSGITDEILQQIRDEILSTKTETIRSLAPIIKSITDTGIVCAMGDENIIENGKELFSTLKTFS